MPSVVDLTFDGLQLHTRAPACTRAPASVLRLRRAPTIVVFDIETTQLIAHGTKIEAMEVSVACAVVLDAERLLTEGELALNDADKVESWFGKGESVEPLLRAFDEAAGIVAHNAFGFDFRVLHRYYKSESRFRSHVSKAFDSLRQLQKAGFKPPLNLGSLLLSNGLGGKSSDGAETAAMWQDAGRHRELSVYCWQDVLLLAQLLSKSEGRLVVHPAAGFRGVSLQTLVAARTGLTRCIPNATDPRWLEQGTRAWFDARKSRITGSLAASCLGAKDAFLNRQQAHDMLRGDYSAKATEAMKRGSELEAYARGAYERHTGRLVRSTGLHLHKGQALGSSPDGIVLDDAGADTAVLLELKVPARGLGRGFGEAYHIQAAMHLLCEPTAQRVDFCTYIAATDELVVKPVYPDKHLQCVLEEQLLAFWENAQNDDEVDIIDPDDLAVLRMALRDAKVESVGVEVVYKGMLDFAVRAYSQNS